MVYPVMLAFLLAALAFAAAQTVPGFRPPAVPLFLNSPYVNVWSAATHLFDVTPSLWNGDEVSMFSAVRVDGIAYRLMGNVNDSLPAVMMTPKQESLVVTSTQTAYSFLCGAVTVNMTFTSPLLPDDWDLLSRPAHYLTYSVAAVDGKAHKVQVYFDATGDFVAWQTEVNMSWSRVNVTGAGEPVTALKIGSTVQTPLQPANGDGDHLNWGNLYVMVADAAQGAADGATVVLEYSNLTRSSFASTGALPGKDNTKQPAMLYPFQAVIPPVLPQVGMDRVGGDFPGMPIPMNTTANYTDCWAACYKTIGCVAWSFGAPLCGGGTNHSECWLKNSFTAPSPNACRTSGTTESEYVVYDAQLAAAVSFNFGTVTATPVTRRVTVAVDEILQIEWFGEPCPPYWRRAMPMNDTTTLPLAMLADAYASYTPTLMACNAFDQTSAALLNTAGGLMYATIAQLTYRQVFGAMGLFYVPSKATPWYMTKEISSCGCLDTADVIYPAFPQVLYYSPELMKMQVIPHLEYAMNYTNQPYPLPWAPHHLGYWPIADLPFYMQENMPLEETAWDLLIIASIAQRQGGDLTWLEPYWPVIQTWYEFLVTLLPFPGTQLSTDDFDGPLYNATNLAFKGVAAVAAYGYILEQYTGNTTAAAEAYATAATYANVMVEYAWLENSTDPSQSHFMIGYKGSQADGGNHTSWAMLYNALWLRLLGFVNLLPDQDSYLTRMEQWYITNQMQEYGLPLNSRALYTKDDWMTFLAATYYTAGEQPQPSEFSNMLFDGLFNWANATLDRVPLSDWTYTNTLDMAGFQARPVYGAMYAPVLVAQSSGYGLGSERDAALDHAREVFQRVHDEIAQAKKQQ